MTGDGPAAQVGPWPTVAPPLGVHVLSEFTFCPRAGLITLGTERTDWGDDYWLRPNLDYQPAYTLYGLRREILATLVAAHRARGRGRRGARRVRRAVPCREHDPLLGRRAPAARPALGLRPPIRPDPRPPQTVGTDPIANAPRAGPRGGGAPAGRLVGVAPRGIRPGAAPGTDPLAGVPSHRPAVAHPQEGGFADPGLPGRGRGTGEALPEAHRPRGGLLRLLEQSAGARSPYAIALFADTYNGWTLPNTPEVRGFLAKVLDAARTHLTPEMMIGPPASQRVCAGCPHGFPGSTAAGRRRRRSSGARCVRMAAPGGTGVSTTARAGTASAGRRRTTKRSRSG